MASGGRAKKFRGNHTHGRGKKAGRGAGLKGGRGRAGANKHRFLMLQILGGKHAHTAARRWGRTGFKSKSRTPEAVALNVGDLQARFPGKADIDLAAAGYTKLLGAGLVTGKLTVKVDTASAGAIEKVKAAGGSVVLLRAPEPATPAKPAPQGAGGGAGAAGKPAKAEGAKPSGPVGGKPEGKGGKDAKPSGKPDKPGQ